MHFGPLSVAGLTSARTYLDGRQGKRDGYTMKWGNAGAALGKAVSVPVLFKPRNTWYLKPDNDVLEQNLELLVAQEDEPAFKQAWQDAIHKAGSAFDAQNQLKVRY